MTRGEEIIKVAELYASASTQIIGDWGEHFLSFIHGAEWADRTMVEKACEWLHSALYLDHERSIEHRYATLEELLNDFRKAMKGD